MSMKNPPQKKVNAVTSASISAGFLGLYYSTLGPHIPDFPQEQTLVGALALGVAWLWFKFLDKDRDGVLDLIENDSLGGAEAEPGSDVEAQEAPEPGSDELEVLTRIRAMLDELDR